MNRPSNSNDSIQTFVDAISAAGREDRTKYHLTLGPFIEQLELVSKVDSGGLPVVTDGGIGLSANIISYRGYYSDCAIRPAAANDHCATVAELLDKARAVFGHTLEGYKGGNYLMGANTPLWVSGYGVCDNLAVMSMVVKDKQLVLNTKYVPF